MTDTDERASTPEPARSRGLTVGLWVVTVLVAFVLVQSGLAKLSAPEAWAGRFAGWGLPGWLVQVVMAVELVGGVLLLVPRLAPWAGAALAAIMLGAFGTHVLNGELGRSPIPLVLGALAAMIGFVRWKDLRS